MNIPKGRAFTLEQKRDIVERLLAVWLEYRYERLGQLIYNRRVTVGFDGRLTGLFNVEDEELVALLEKRKFIEEEARLGILSIKGVEVFPPGWFDPEEDDK